MHYALSSTIASPIDALADPAVPVATPSIACAPHTIALTALVTLAP